MSYKTLAIILAAGEGTRMKSDLPKVLHPVAGKAMVGHVIDTVKQAGIDEMAVIVGPHRGDVTETIKKYASHAQIFVQHERKGTAHAVLQAKDVLIQKFTAVIILFADTPLVQPQTIRSMLKAVTDDAVVAALGFHADDPTGYGRLLQEEGQLIAIREHKDATSEEKNVRFCNAGLMALSGQYGLELLSAVDNKNVQNEYYLPDVVEIAHQKGLKTAALEAPFSEVQGVNDRVQLATAEAQFQKTKRIEHMRNGVTLQAPETVFFSHDTIIERDVTIESHVVFGEGVHIKQGSVVHAFSHLAGAQLGRNVSIGPYARLRPGTNLHENVKIGNFVELKATVMHKGAKASHLTYLGDAEIGAESNIGAGTIICNYDGYHKYKTTIGSGAFIGSNSALVAPVTIGDGAYVASGSVIVDNVTPDALALARSRQLEKPGWAKDFRANIVKK